MDANNRFIQISPDDNVAVALTEVDKGFQAMINGSVYTVQENIPFGHKIALSDIGAGESIIKYGNPIGHAIKPIKAGEWVHIHNTETNLEGLLNYTYTPTVKNKVDVKDCRNTFEGYVRTDGDVGTRNEIWIIPTVSCVNQTVRTLAELAQEKYGDCCDGIIAYPHNAGCSQLGEDHETTQRILASIIHHPNAGGVLVVSLGCENNDLNHFMPVIGNVDPSRIKFMITQNVEDEIEEGLRLIGEIADTVSRDKRQTVSVSKLKLALKCGGSDAFSGITANPLCGCISDRITALGGSAIITEVSEMFGAETFLMSRADNEETFQKIVMLINSFKKYYMDYGQPIYENPSPGNKEGGLTTDEEKSLGCIQKGGYATVTDTLDYGQKCTKQGLNLMNGPGNDNVSITNLLSAGSQILLFTTGRGNPLGTAMPTIKLSSNSKLYDRKKCWIDFDSGILLNGKTFKEATDQLWDMLLDVASGKIKTKSELYGYREIMIFKDGVIL